METYNPGRDSPTSLQSTFKTFLSAFLVYVTSHNVSMMITLTSGLNTAAIND